MPAVARYLPFANSVLFFSLIVFANALLIDCVLTGALSDDGPAAAEGPSGELELAAGDPRLESHSSNDFLLTGEWWGDRSLGAGGTTRALALGEGGGRCKMDRA